MGGPCGEKLREGDGAEGRVQATTLQVFGSESEGFKLAEIFRAQPGKVVEELRKGFALTGAGLAESVKGGEGLRFAILKDDPCAGHPIAGFAVGEVADYVIDRPSSFTFAAVGPGFGEVAEESV